jgi:hypothetical protein
MKILRFVAALTFAAVLVPAADIDSTTNSTAAREATRRAFLRSWELSLIPLVASQSLDAASSYGYRELNPLLADPNGAFGARATTVKFSVVFALIGVEYLLVRNSPWAARLFEKLNWATSAVTTGLAVRNYIVR